MSPEELDAMVAAYEDVLDRNWGAADQKAVKRIAMRAAMQAGPCDHGVVSVKDGVWSCMNCGTKL